MTRTRIIVVSVLAVLVIAAAIVVPVGLHAHHTASAREAGYQACTSQAVEQLRAHYSGAKLANGIVFVEKKCHDDYFPKK